MTTHRGRPRPFLDTSEAETTANLGELKDTLAEAVRDAERLGLPDVREHLAEALARAVERDEGHKAIGA